jgi:hypothetical protein
MEQKSFNKPATQAKTTTDSSQLHKRKALKKVNWHGALVFVARAQGTATTCDASNKSHLKGSQHTLGSEHYRIPVVSIPHFLSSGAVRADASTLCHGLYAPLLCGGCVVELPFQPY